MNLADMDIFSFILRGIAVIISLTIHEYAHALISHVQGDKTPEYYGRLTTNPLAHLDLMGLIALFIFKFGWAKPVPINSSNYKNERLGVILTSLAGPFSNILLAFLSALILVGVNPENAGVQSFLVELLFMNIGLAVFNMLPFPPLDGSKIFGEIFGGRIAEFIYKMDRYGIFILFMLLWIPGVNAVLRNIMESTAVALIKLAMLIV